MVASRFVAGITMEDAIHAVLGLNQKGINVTLDYLGENISNAKDAENSTQAILKIIDEIDERKVRANVSIKLTQIGMSIDRDLCEKQLVQILEFAQEKKNFVRIDMEDSQYVDATLQLYRLMRKVYGFENTGVVIQSYLYRSRADIENLLQTGARVRLCKGAYDESAAVAYPRKKDVDHAYDLLTDHLLQGSISANIPRISEDGRIPPIPAIATHDPARIQHAKDSAKRLNFPKNALEFQMLYGIRRELQDDCVREGYPVRVYVPFGTQWYPYFMRRLAERPANLWFFVSNLIRN